jgi:hypothetical protein
MGSDSTTQDELSCSSDQVVERYVRAAKEAMYAFFSRKKVYKLIAGNVMLIESSYRGLLHN